MALNGVRVTSFMRTCHGKKGVNKPCSFSCSRRKCPKTHEKSLVHAFANSQVVTTKRTPFHKGGVEVNWSYKFFLSIYLYTVHTLHTKRGMLGCNSPNVRNSVNTLFLQSFHVLTPPALSVFTPFLFLFDNERPDMLRFFHVPPYTRLAGFTNLPGTTSATPNQIQSQ